MGSLTRTMACAVVAGGITLAASACSSSSSSSPSSAPASSATTSGSTASASPAASGGKFTIALVPGDSTDPFYLSMEAAAQAEATKLGMGFIFEGAPAFSPEAQQPVLAALLARHPSALLVAPTDPGALTGTLQQFKSAGIPIITVDTTITNTSILTSRITSNNTQGGSAAADACGSVMKGSGTAAVIYTTPGTTTTNARGQGFIAEMKAKYPNVSVVTEYDNNTESTADSQVSSLLLAHPNLGCVFGTNDYAAEGAATAVDAAHDQSKVTIAGYDAEPQMVTLLKNGTINIIIAQKPALEAQMAVEYAYDALTGKSSSIPASVQLPNVTMTKANISQPSVAQWIYK
jgi:ribose transport system substrate-binding protein